MDSNIDVRKCEVCGKEFVPKFNYERLCSEDCRKVKRSENAKRYNEKKKKKKKELMQNQKKIEEIAVRAKASGMSYGYYTALYVERGK